MHMDTLPLGQKPVSPFFLPISLAQESANQAVLSSAKLALPVEEAKQQEWIISEL